MSVRLMETTEEDVLVLLIMEFGKAKYGGKGEEQQHGIEQNEARDDQPAYVCSHIHSELTLGIMGQVKRATYRAEP